MVSIFLRLDNYGVLCASRPGIEIKLVLSFVFCWNSGIARGLGVRPGADRCTDWQLRSRSIEQFSTLLVCYLSLKCLVATKRHPR